MASIQYARRYGKQQYEYSPRVMMRPVPSSTWRNREHAICSALTMIIPEVIMYMIPSSSKRWRAYNTLGIESEWEMRDRSRGYNRRGSAIHAETTLVSREYTMHSPTTMIIPKVITDVIPRCIKK